MKTSFNRLEVNICLKYLSLAKRLKIVRLLHGTNVKDVKWSSNICLPYLKLVDNDHNKLLHEFINTDKKIQDNLPNILKLYRHS